LVVSSLQVSVTDTTCADMTIASIAIAIAAIVAAASVIATGSNLTLTAPAVCTCDIDLGDVAYIAIFVA
jgi:hypothetical protein